MIKTALFYFRGRIAKLVHSGGRHIVIDTNAGEELSGRIEDGQINAWYHRILIGEYSQIGSPQILNLHIAKWLLLNYDYALTGRHPT